MNDSERRGYDKKMDLLIESMDQCTIAVKEHAYVINQNRQDLDCVIASQDKLTKLVTTHVEEENETIGLIATYFRDWAGIVRWANRIGKAGKWLGSIGLGTGIVVHFWDKVIHFVKGIF